mmetsp:Transcript_85644/g.242548  ORF Transcript_85644/g.242548 Transcript_85644/m.242548 type:complete len:230 (-) Transcript_85644:1679-2368(-)
MNCFSASPILSWRSVRRRKSRWNGDRSRALLGRSAVSGRSSPNQRFQPKESCSTDSVSLPPFLKASMPSSDFSCAHCVSVSQLLMLSGITDGVGSRGARMSRPSSSGWTSPERTRTRSASMDATVSLSASRRPRRRKLKTNIVTTCFSSTTRCSSSAPRSSTMNSSSSSALPSLPYSSASASSSSLDAFRSGSRSSNCTVFGGGTSGFLIFTLCTARLTTITKASREYL